MKQFSFKAWALMPPKNTPVMKMQLFSITKQHLDFKTIIGYKNCP
jgi:hypothetical protein